MEKSKTLRQVVDSVLTDMKSIGFSDGSIAVYRCALNRMLSIADEGGDDTYSIHVRDKFLNESIYLPDGSLSDSRRKLHKRELSQALSQQMHFHKPFQLLKMPFVIKSLRKEP